MKRCTYVVWMWEQILYCWMVNGEVYLGDLAMLFKTSLVKLWRGYTSQIEYGMPGRLQWQSYRWIIILVVRNMVVLVLWAFHNYYYFPLFSVHFTDVWELDNLLRDRAITRMKSIYCDQFYYLHVLTFKGFLTSRGFCWMSIGDLLLFVVVDFRP